MPVRLKLKEQIRGCTDCELYRVGNGPVPFYGNPSDILIVAEAPGRREDQVGKPLVGPAGQLLWRALAKYGIERADVMRANAVCCWPNATPSPDHTQACRGNLHNQVKYCDPRWILALGRVANASLGDKGKMRDIRGRWYDQRIVHTVHRMRVFPTYHPAAVLRDQTLTRQWHLDLKLFSEVVQRSGSSS